MISKAAKGNSLTFIVNHLFGKVCKTEAFFLLKYQSDTITPDVKFGGFFLGLFLLKNVVRNYKQPQIVLLQSNLQQRDLLKLLGFFYIYLVTLSKNL